MHAVIDLWECARQSGFIMSILQYSISLLCKFIYLSFNKILTLWQNFPVLLRVVDSLHAEVRIVQVPLLSQSYLCIPLETFS